MTRISWPHSIVIVRFGSTRPAFTSWASVRAISVSVPTPEASSFAPGSWTCALYTKRSSGRALPRASATTASSVAGWKNRDRVSTCRRTGPAAAAARSCRRASNDSAMPQAFFVESYAIDWNWIEWTFFSGCVYAGIA